MSDEDMTPMLPAAGLLGYGVDLSSTVPINLGSISHATPTNQRSITVNPHIAPIQEVGSEKVKYRVPSIIRVVNSQQSLTKDLITFPTGSEAQRTFRSSQEAASNYLALTADDPSSLPVSQTFPPDRQFGFFEFHTQDYNAALDRYLDFINEAELLPALRELPKPFTPAALGAYRNFFSQFGTHIFLSARYGSRYQMCIWASNRDQVIKQNFSRDVAAAFHGITTSGNYDGTVFEERQYQRFRTLEQRLVSIVGGDENDAAILKANPTNLAAYTQWKTTSNRNPKLIGASTTTIWNLLRDARSDEVYSYANPVQDAYLYILSNPRTDYLSVTLSIYSTWGEFGLISPSVSIYVPEDELRLRAERISTSKITMTDTRYKWERIEDDEGDEVRTRKPDIPAFTTIFYLVTDGNPIDFYLSSTLHGRVKFTVGQNDYLLEPSPKRRSKATENTKSFFRVYLNVNRKPVRINDSLKVCEMEEAVAKELANLAVESDE